MHAPLTRVGKSDQIICFAAHWPHVSDNFVIAGFESDRSALAAGEHCEEVNHILVFRKDLVVVEVNVVTAGALPQAP
jgi:hypothetical protein